MDRKPPPPDPYPPPLRHSAMEQSCCGALRTFSKDPSYSVVGSMRTKFAAVMRSAWGCELNQKHVIKKKKKKSPLHLRLKVEWRFYFFLIFPNWLTRETLKLSVSSLIKTSLFCKEMCFTFAKTLFVQLALLCPLNGFRPARNHDRSFFLFFKFLFWNDKPEIKRQFYYNPKTIAWFLSPFLSPSYTQVSALNKLVKSPNHSGSVC